MFWGYYPGDTRARREFCLRQGVDIQPFVSAFEMAHAKELAEARIIYKRESADTDTLYEVLKPEERKSVELQMNSLATKGPISLKQACELFAEHADALAKALHLSKALPAVERVLLSAK